MWQNLWFQECVITICLFISQEEKVFFKIRHTTSCSWNTWKGIVGIDRILLWFSSWWNLPFRRFRLNSNVFWARIAVEDMYFYVGISAGGKLYVKPSNLRVCTFSYNSCICWCICLTQMVLLSWLVINRNYFLNF